MMHARSSVNKAERLQATKDQRLRVSRGHNLSQAGRYPHSVWKCLSMAVPCKTQASVELVASTWTDMMASASMTKTGNLRNPFDIW